MRESKYEKDYFTHLDLIEFDKDDNASQKVVKPKKSEVIPNLLFKDLPEVIL